MEHSLHLKKIIIPVLYMSKYVLLKCLSFSVPVKSMQMQLQVLHTKKNPRTQKNEVIQTSILCFCKDIQ